MTATACLAVSMGLLSGIWLAITGAQDSRRIDDHIARFLAQVDRERER